MLAVGAEEKKKLYILGGLLAALGVVAVVLFNPFGGKQNSTPAAPPPEPGGAPKEPPKEAPKAPAPPGPAGAPAPAAAPAEGGGGGATASAAAAPQINPIRTREDPFQPFYTTPLLPTPTPVPLPPISIAPPSVSPMSLPSPGMQANSMPRTALISLPAPVIHRRSGPASGAVMPPPRPTGEIGVIPRSPNKRLSGVIIGDGVRALLEYPSGEETVTRVVQPGDEVDGIKILNIERFVEGGRTITRMYVMEDNRESYVDLRAAPQQTTAAGGAEGGGPTRGGRPPGPP